MRISRAMVGLQTILKNANISSDNLSDTMKNSIDEIRKNVNDWYIKNSTPPKYYVKDLIKYCHPVRVRIIHLILEEAKTHSALHIKMQKIIEMTMTEEPRDDVKDLIKSMIGDIRVHINEKFF